jgi:type VI secretion system secreted protein VgrG
MRVSQGWAGGGYGMIAIPRVGQEVLVAFLEGDPDQPVVVGRLYNGTSRVPYDLPEHKTRSGWRTDSSPGSGGFNELMFEDAKHQELVYLQAERDFERLVKNNESKHTMGNSINKVGGNRSLHVGGTDMTVAGSKHSVTITPKEDNTSQRPTGIELVDKKIVLTTGDASITMDGPNVRIVAKGRIVLKSLDDDVVLLGGPMVKINCASMEELEALDPRRHIFLQLVHDATKEPLANVKYKLKFPDGTEIPGVSDDRGCIEHSAIPEGEYEVILDHAWVSHGS